MPHVSLTGSYRKTSVMDELLPLIKKKNKKTTTLINPNISQAGSQVCGTQKGENLPGSKRKGAVYPFC